MNAKNDEINNKNQKNKNNKNNKYIFKNEN